MHKVMFRHMWSKNCFIYCSQNAFIFIAYNHFKRVEKHKGTYLVEDWKRSGRFLKTESEPVFESKRSEISEFAAG